MHGLGVPRAVFRILLFSVEMAPHRKAVVPKVPPKGGPGGVKGERAHGRSRLSNMVGRLPDVDRRTAAGPTFPRYHPRALTIDAGAIVPTTTICPRQSVS
jgi:hypothetical protein